LRCHPKFNFSTLYELNRIFAKYTRMQSDLNGNRPNIRVRERRWSVTRKSNPLEKIKGTPDRSCPINADEKSEFIEHKGTAGKSCPIQSKILNSNFKTGAINRSATPPGKVVRAYFRISQAMGKVDRAVSLGAP
jgi:hypothetical protein